jgi:hypothetical protein
VVAGLFRNGTNRLLWREADGGWNSRFVAGNNRSDLRHLSAWSLDLIAVADSSAPSLDFNGTFDMGCGGFFAAFSSAMPTPDEAWFGTNAGRVCRWLRDGGFSQVELSPLIGLDVSGPGQATRIEGVWVMPDGRRFFGGSLQTVIGERRDGGWAISRIPSSNPPEYNAVRGAETAVIAVGQRGIVAKWDDTSEDWRVEVGSTANLYSDVWVENARVAFVSGQTGGPTGDSFIARLDGDGGVTSLLLDFGRSIQLLAITGTTEALYVGGRSLDGGGAVLFRVRR